MGRNISVPNAIQPTVVLHWPLSVQPTAVYDKILSARAYPYMQPLTNFIT